MTLKTLADVRTLIGHLPANRRTGRHGATSPHNSMRLLPVPIRSTSLSRCAWC